MEINSSSASQELYCSTSLTTAYCVSFLVFDAVIFLGITVGNTLVVMSVVRFSNMRSTTNAFLASLAVADLSVAFLCIPIDVILALGVVADVSPLVCLIGSQLTSVSFAVSTTHLVVVAYDRFLAISRPLQYRGHMTTNRVRVFICASWSVAILLSLVPFFGWNSLGSYELGYCDLLFIHPFSYRCTAIVFLAFVPFTTMGYFYWRIFKVAREQRRRIWEQAQVFRIGQRNLGFELKAAKTLGLIMGIFILEYTPASLVSCADAIFTVEELSIFKLFSFHLLYSNSAVNPMMYAFRSKEFRGAFVKLLRTIFPCCELRKGAVVRTNDETGPATVTDELKRATSRYDTKS